MQPGPAAALVDRAATRADLAAVLELIVACDIEDVGEPDYSLADLEGDWAYARFDLAADARLLVDPDGGVRAYVAVRQLDPGRRLLADLYVHPGSRGGRAELWGVAFAEERAATLGAAPDASLHLYAEEGSALARLFTVLGYEDVRRMWRMEIDLTGVPVGDDEPTPVPISTFDPADARAVHAAVEEAFADDPDHRAETFDEWAARRIDHGDFDPATWWVAWDGDQVVGVLLASVADGVEAAFISTVGVRPAWRGRGIASALLRTAFRELAARGVTKAALGVDSRNATGATRSYERAGMHVTRCWVRYERRVA